MTISYRELAICDTSSKKKTEAGKRKLPINEDVEMMFQAIVEDREPRKLEKVIDGHTEFLFYNDDGDLLVAMHWQHRFIRMVR